MKKFRVTVEGETYEVEVEELDEGGQSAPSPSPSKSSAPKSAPKSEPKQEAASGGDSAPSSGGGDDITAPIAGNVLEVKVSPGDQVESGQVVMILEAMKMENEISAEGSGTVKEVKADKGASVNSGDTLIVLE